MTRIVIDASSMKISGISGGQFEGFALVSKIRELRAQVNSKELNEAG